DRGTNQQTLRRSAGRQTRRGRGLWVHRHQHQRVKRSHRGHLPQNQPEQQVQRRRVSARASRDVLTGRQHFDNSVAREKQDRLVLARLTAHGGQIHYHRARAAQSETQNLRWRTYWEWPYRRDESGHERRRAEVHASARAAGRRDFGWRHPRRGLRRYTEGAYQWGRHRRVWREWYVIR